MDKPIDHLFPTRQELMDKFLCLSGVFGGKCAGDGTASEFKDSLSRREYGITGMCQACQDELEAYEDEE